jgi:hypothetical protein
LGGWIISTVLDQQLSEFGFEIQSRIRFEHFLDNAPRHLIKAKTEKLNPGAQVDKRYFVCQAGCNSWGGVKCYRLPDQIGAFWWHLMFRAELTGSIRAIHLKPIVPSVSREEA